MRSNPAKKYFAVVPSDSALDNRRFTGLFVGTGGALSIVSDDGVAVEFSNVSNGQILPIEGVRINASGTTALGIVGFVYEG